MGEGYYETVTRIKADATPIDNVTKFAWADEDYETVQIWHEYTEAELDEIEVLEAAALKAAEREEFLADAPDRMADAEDALGELGIMAADSETTIDDIMLAIAELAAIITGTEA